MLLVNQVDQHVRVLWLWYVTWTNTACILLKMTCFPQWPQVAPELYYVMWMQEVRNWHYGKKQFLLLIVNTIKNAHLGFTPGYNWKYKTLWQKYDLKHNEKQRSGNCKKSDTSFLHKHDDFTNKIVKGLQQIKMFMVMLCNTDELAFWWK